MPHMGNRDELFGRPDTSMYRVVRQCFEILCNNVAFQTEFAQLVIHQKSYDDLCTSHVNSNGLKVKECVCSSYTC